jgi:GNAT superfamily N-acetyltransferase
VHRVVGGPGLVAGEAEVVDAAAASEVFGLDAPDGKGLAGAVVLTRWGTDLASVGMMLVAARYGRRGLGQALMEHLLRAAGEDCTVWSRPWRQ